MEDNKQDFFEKFVSDLKAYINTLIRLNYLIFAERLSVVLSRLIFAGILFILFILLFLFSSIALGYYIAEYTGRVSYGFLFISGFYILVILGLYISRNRFLKKILANFFIKSILNTDKKNNE